MVEQMSVIKAVPALPVLVALREDAWERSELRMPWIEELDAWIWEELLVTTASDEILLIAEWAEFIIEVPVWDSVIEWILDIFNKRKYSNVKHSFNLLGISNKR
ncbi:hypothetical protein DFQ29_000209 [Apophysomyces sp. BC1021]|nr:hypothetical protein DFQ29_000209 [Apophysomyces sp. BC1021]